MNLLFAAYNWLFPAAPTRDEREDYLQAVISGSALLITARGDIGDAEIDSYSAFFGGNLVIAGCWAKRMMIDAFRAALIKATDTTARAELFGDLAKFNGKPEAVKIAEFICVGALASGELSTEERQALGQICRTLGLNAADFVSEQRQILAEICQAGSGL